MKRLVFNKLVEWKKSKYRKPLILNGARQVGKTWIMKEFGNKHYQNTAYFNFDGNEELKDIFAKTKDPNRILDSLRFVSKEPINKETTLIIFDEIQECTEALNSLKYFCEDAPSYHVITAGSLLGITLSKTSFPVGKVEFLNIYPMTFIEFLMADGSDNLVEYIKSINEIKEVPTIIFSMLEEKLKAFYIIGGMPEAVRLWVETKNMGLVDKVQEDILETYQRDFSKHIDKSEVQKINLVWNSLPSQLARENKKFLYQTVKDGARAREYENAVNWLANAGLVNKIYKCSSPHLPLSAYDDLSAFKIYLGDTGLLRRMSYLDSKVFIEGKRLFTEFKGALTENYVLQMLSTVFEVLPRYWTLGSNAEMDYIIQYENEIFPIEVKAETNVNSNSLKIYQEKNNPKFRIRLSLNNFSKDGNIINVPLFFVEVLDKIIDIANKEK